MLAKAFAVLAIRRRVQFAFASVIVQALQDRILDVAKISLAQILLSALVNEDRQPANPDRDAAHG